MRFTGIAALCAVVAFVVLHPTAAHAAPCAGESACKQSCENGARLACRELGRIRAAGEGIDPDHKGAVEAWSRGCYGYAPGKKPTKEVSPSNRDARSCLEMALLVRDGWTLDVPKDAFGAENHLYEGMSLAWSECDAGNADACFTMAMTNRSQIEWDGWQSYYKETAKQVLEFAKTGCAGGVLESCMYIRKSSWELSNHSLLTNDEMKPFRDAADKQLGELCKGGDPAACLDLPNSVLRDEKIRKVVKQEMTEKCDAKNQTACLAKAMVMSAELGDPEDSQLAMDKVKEVLETAFDACETGLTHEICPSIANELAKEGEDSQFAQFGFKSDRPRALKMLKSQCKQGSKAACDAAAEYLEGVEDKTSRELYNRSCQLSPPTADGQVVTCSVCYHDGLDDLPECLYRDTWQMSSRCLEGNLEECEALGDRYGEGYGVDKSPPDSAQSYKYACDGSIKTACGKLDDVCHAHDDIGEQICAPSLLHTDVFYEAEWQLRMNQSATLSKGTDATPGTGFGSVTIADAVNGGASLSASRGKLDADLVVSVVLDRARQAAAKLLAEELRDKMGAAGLRSYMKDLLDQGAMLLANATSLRRDALQDLGMTLVRAFAASNLVRTTLGDVETIKNAPVIGAIVKTWKDKWLVRDGRLAPDLEAYLADLAYWALGVESLFARTGATDDPAPACPFKDDRKKLCEAVTTRAQVTEALKIEGVLTALNMVRALGTEGGIDVRRLIEAIAQSRSIVDFASTPGLNLSAWESRIVGGLRNRAGTLKNGIGTLTILLDEKTYEAGSSSLDLPTLAGQLRSLEAFVGSSDVQLLLGADLAKDLAPLISVANLMPEGLGAQPTPELLAAAREKAKGVLAGYTKSWRDTLDKQITATKAKLQTLDDALAELVKHIRSVRTSLEHHQTKGTDIYTKLAIDDVPLGDLDELLLVFPQVVVVLDTLDSSARELFAGIDLRGVRFARSSVVRLLGFLDLMGRVARSVRLTQTIAQVIDTLELLGRWHEGEFSAPLYDMLQPVLDVIETRTPMPLEQLFAIIGRVRLDSLVTSLMSDSPCSNEGRAECWVFKIAYSLQEAITRDGDSIKIDGAEVAKRLSKFGDDFRRRNKGRWYFHLTVGVGSLFSPPPPDPAGGVSDDLRFTPLIAEQVGFGYASPAIWKDRLTFKVGLCASGILYRMLLDNEESNAVMGMGFVAMDVYDLVEVYAAGTVLAYPPDDMSNARVEPGIAVGLSVPLSAYLEKL